MVAVLQFPNNRKHTLYGVMLCFQLFQCDQISIIFCASVCGLQKFWNIFPSMRHRFQNNNENEMLNEQQNKSQEKTKTSNQFKIAFPQLNNSIYGLILWMLWMRWWWCCRGNKQTTETRKNMETNETWRQCKRQLIAIGNW